MNADYHRKHSAHRITLQVAVEAIVNHEADGYDLETMSTVLDDARDAGVPNLYVDMLAELVADTAERLGAPA